MQAAAIWRWWAASTAKSPATWAILLLSFLWIPVASRLSPFPAMSEGYPAHLAGSWALVFACLGASRALLFLAEGQGVLERLPSRVRWGGELGTLALAILLPLGALCAGLSFSKGGSEGFAALSLQLVLLSAHVAALSCLVGRLPAPVAVRIATLVGVLWLGPAWFHATWIGPLLDPTGPIPDLERVSFAPRALVASLLATLGLALLGLLTYLPPMPRKTS